MDAYDNRAEILFGWTDTMPVKKMARCPATFFYITIISYSWIIKSFESLSKQKIKFGLGIIIQLVALVKDSVKVPVFFVPFY
jgi:hypothetical protein